MNEECRLNVLTDASCDEDDERPAENNKTKAVQSMATRKFIPFKAINALDYSLDNTKKSFESIDPSEAYERPSHKNLSFELAENKLCIPIEGLGIQKIGKNINSAINYRREEANPEGEKWGQEENNSGKGGSFRKSESPTFYQRSPSNKVPVKAFAGMEVKTGIEEKKNINQVDLGKKNKFSFGGLTIDVEEANKQMNSGKAPPQLSRIVSPPASVNFQPVERKETIDFLRVFYQEQIDKLTSKNEDLLRENERLKMELSQSNHHAAECKLLRLQLSELQRRLDNQSIISRENASIGVYGEIKLNSKVRGQSDIHTFGGKSSEKLFQSIEASNKDSMPNSAKVKQSDLRKSQLGQLQFQNIHKHFEKPLVTEAFEDRSLTCSRSSNELKNCKSNDKLTDCMEEYQYDFRRITSQNASFDTRELQEKDSNHLKDFISKLKQASEGIAKNLKVANSHKKTNSMASAQSKRRDLTGYYVKNKRSKENDASKNDKGVYSKISIGTIEKPEHKIYMVASKSHASNLVKNIEKNLKHYSQAQSMIKDSPVNISSIQDSKKDKNHPSEIKKGFPKKETKVILNGLLKHSRPPSEQIKISTSLSKKKNSASSNSVKAADIQ